MSPKHISVLTIILFFIACNDPTPSDVSVPSDSNSKGLFTLLSAENSGIDFTNQLNDDPTTDRNVLSFAHFYNGAGVAIGDINNDGLKDVFLSGNDVPNKLYLNKGDMKFEDISEKAGINVNKTWSTGVTMADVNDDGFLDIYVCQFGPNEPKNRQNLMYINNGDLSFSEKGKEMGINDSNESSHAAFFDYDNDGDLDLYVLNESKYVRVVFQTVFEALKIKKNLEAASGNMFRNDGGKFTRVTEAAGMLRYGFGLGLCVSDINEDGWLDVYVANDYSVPDFMYINNGDGTFTDQIKDRTKQITYFGMGCDIADINNDGHVDIGVVDMATSDHFRGKTLMESMDVKGFRYFVNELKYQYQYMFNSLQLNNGTGKFNNIAHMAGVGQTEWSWAALFADFDNDGSKDYFISNGFRRYARDNDFRLEMEKVRKENGGTVPMKLRKEMYAKMPEVKLPNQMFRNDGKLKFDEVTSDWGLAQPSYSSGAAYGDLDNDGDLDLVVSNIDHPAFIYKNNTSEKNSSNYLQVKLKAEKQAHISGAKVTVYTGDEIQFRESLPTRGYLSSVENTLHFGLGDKKSVDKIRVIWQDGKEQIVSVPEINKTITITKASNTSLADFSKKKKENLPFESINPKSLGIDFSYKKNTYDDFAVQILLPHQQSDAGPRVRVADVDNDGLEDVFLCGGVNQSSELYFQNTDGSFSKSETRPWDFDAASEDSDALFFDVDGDGDQDLYIVSGGYEYPDGSPKLIDRLYINFGKRQFQKVRIPEIAEHGSVAKAADFDQDGDLDIFVGGASNHARYPFAAKSYILRNEGRTFSQVSEEEVPGLGEIGLVKDAEWTDLNGDKFPELVMVGEWMPITVFQNNNGKLSDASEQYGTDELKGWWYSLKSADIDNDGDMDFIVGNLGLNNKFHPSLKKPFRVFANDFDKTGSCDVVLSKEYNGKLVPTRGRECSSDQMPFITSKFPTYKEFANADLEDILGEEEVENALKREVNNFQSGVLMNSGGTFEFKTLPVEAQLAPVLDIVTTDINDDGNVDLILGGNMYDTEVETPRYDAGDGLVLTGDGKGNFKAKSISETGWYIPHNVKSFDVIKRSNSDDLIIVGNNNRPLQIFSLRKDVGLTEK